MIISEISEAIQKVCPIHGVNSDGVISFKDEATQEQRAAAVDMLGILLPSLGESSIATLVAEVKADAQRIILAKWPLWAQQNCNDGTYAPEDKEQMLTDKALVLTECTRLVTALEAGQSAIPNWPTI